MSPLEPTDQVLGLAATKEAKSLGFARDVKVSIEKYTFPADFYVADYEPHSRVTIISGRPFMATSCARLDFDSRKMELRVGEASLYFLSSYAYDESDEEEDDVWELTKELERMTTTDT